MFAQSDLITQINTLLSPSLVNQANIGFVILPKKRARTQRNGKTRQKDYKQNQIQFHAVPYTGGEMDVQKLINFLMATYQKYAPLLPENLVKRCVINQIGLLILLSISEVQQAKAYHQ